MPESTGTTRQSRRRLRQNLPGPGPQRPGFIRRVINAVGRGARAVGRFIGSASG